MTGIAESATENEIEMNYGELIESGYSSVDEIFVQYD